MEWCPILLDYIYYAANMEIEELVDVPMLQILNGVPTLIYGDFLNAF